MPHLAVSMRHVLGMAKRHLDLRGAKAPKLELDFLRLLFAVRELQRRGDDARGYLLVMTPNIGERTLSWSQKYGAEGDVEVVVADMTDIDHKLIEAEARANAQGMVAGTLGEDVAGRSDARAGGRLAETGLRVAIEARERGVRQVTDGAPLPLGIRWDYYGVAEGA